MADLLGALFLFAVSGERFGDFALLLVALVKQHAVAQRQGFSGLDRVRSVFACSEGFESKWIGGEQPVGPHVPMSRITEAAGVVHDGDAECLAFDRSVEIDPRGAFPPGGFVDFAFAVHTDVGYHCIGAKVNGKMVPIRHELKSGDSVEIITSPNQKPTPDWINFVKTSKARSRIKRWLKESFYEQSLKLGEEILTKSLKKYGIKKEFDLNEIAQSFNFQKAEQLFAAIGCGDTSIQTVMNRIAPEERVEIKDTSVLQRFIKRARGSAKGIRVQGLDELMIKFGGCCHPVPGDNILGFITKGRGIVVHRSDCRNIINLLANPDRKIDVEWDVDKDKHFRVRLQLVGGDRKHFLRDVSDSISQTDTNIVSIDMKVEDTVVNSNIILEVRNLQHLTRIVKKISQVKGVMNVERLNGTGEKISDTSAFVNQDSK